MSLWSGTKARQVHKQWGLSRSEKEVAHLSIKGFSIAEIAKLRGKSEGTAKA